MFDVRDTAEGRQVWGGNKHYICDGSNYGGDDDDDEICLLAYDMSTVFR